MRHTSYLAPLVLALATPAAAQPAAVPGTPAVTPTAPPAATPAEPTAGDAAVPVDGAPATPTGEPVPPVEPVAPVEPPPPPPPPPPRFTGLLPSTAADQHLATHDQALEGETTVPDHPFTASVFGDYWFSAGPRVGGTAGMYRAFEAHLGVLIDSTTTMPTPPAAPTSTSSTRIFYGVTVGLLSYRGVQLAGGIVSLTGRGDAPDTLLTGQLTVPLDAHWLPFRVANSRLRITYPVGVGIEWGLL